MSPMFVISRMWMTRSTSGRRVIIQTCRSMRRLAKSRNQPPHNFMPMWRPWAACRRPSNRVRPNISRRCDRSSNGLSPVVLPMSRKGMCCFHPMRWMPKAECCRAMAHWPTGHWMKWWPVRGLMSRHTKKTQLILCCGNRRKRMNRAGPRLAGSTAKGVRVGISNVPP